jgi:hypothetical protein
MTHRLYSCSGRARTIKEIAERLRQSAVPPGLSQLTHALEKPLVLVSGSPRIDVFLEDATEYLEELLRCEEHSNH